MDEEYNFAASINNWIDEVKGDQEQAVRAIGMQILGRIIERSPVGDPKRWKVNRAFALAQQHASAVNSAQRRKNGGRLKRGQKKKPSALIQFQTAKGAVTFRQRGWAAKGYTGGRFRGNWQVTFNRPATTPIERVDKQGTRTLEAGDAVLRSFDGSKDTAIYFSNMLPYARRLEYGWSNQAPNGILRVTVAEIKGKVA